MLFWPILCHFWCPVVTLVILVVTLVTLKNPTTTKKNLNNIKKHQKSQKSLKSHFSSKNPKFLKNIVCQRKKKKSPNFSISGLRDSTRALQSSPIIREKSGKISKI